MTANMVNILPAKFRHANIVIKCRLLVLLVHYWHLATDEDNLQTVLSCWENICVCLKCWLSILWIDIHFEIYLGFFYVKCWKKTVASQSTSPAAHPSCYQQDVSVVLQAVETRRKSKRRRTLQGKMRKSWEIKSDLFFLSLCAVPK